MAAGTDEAMDLALTSEDDGELLPTAPGQRACDQCRKRKVRCDRKRPCAHCRAASIPCKTTTKRQEQKSRVMVSKEYETKIDKMDARLASIEHLLRGLADQRSSSAAAIPSHKTDDPTTVRAFANNSSSNQIDHSHRRFSRESSVVGTGPNVDLTEAKQLFEKIIGKNPRLQQSVSEALYALHNIVGQLNASDTTEGMHHNPMSMGTISALPTWAQVEAILQKASDPNAGVVNWVFPCITLSDFAQRARRLWERQHRDVPSRRLLIYAGLFGLCYECSVLDSGEVNSGVDRPGYYHELSQIFQQLVSFAAAELPIVLPPCKESVDALVAGSIVAVDMCKPVLSWTLASAALGLCQTLGYHRLSSMVDDSEEVRASKIFLFWLAYMQDRTVGLRLGRAPGIHRSHILVPHPRPSVFVPEPLIAVLEFWIGVANTHGDILDRLYSPAAASQTLDQRSQVTEELAERFQRVWKARQIDEGSILQYLDAHSSTVAGMMILGDVVVYYGTMALIYHAKPTESRSNSPALEYARKFLRAIQSSAHTHCNNAYTWSSYCHWALLNSPLTPFTVIFCEVITNYRSSHEDLQLMRSYVACLYPACRLSTGVQKFYDLVSVFLRVAEAYTAAKIAEEDNHANDGVLVTGEFDEHLSSLGFAPFPHQTNEFGTAGDTSAYLQDWYAGNASLYGLLDRGIEPIETGRGEENGMGHR